MKILFFSDIHGVPATLRALFDAADVLRPDLMVLLGDALYHGPRNGVPHGYDPAAVAALLNSRRDQILAVRGNCDAEVDQMMLEFPIMADISELQTPHRRFYLTHGHRWNAANLPPMSANAILTHGHTHIPELKTLENGTMVFNPGSITLPKNGNPRSFGFYDGAALKVINLEDGKNLNILISREL